MKLANALFVDPEALIFQVHLDDDWHDDNCLDWNVEEIKAPILAAEYARDAVLDGEFILKAQMISASQPHEICYLGITMPEGILNNTYTREGTQIVKERRNRWPGKEAIPLVAIDKYIDYEVYYSKIDPEVGLRVLRNAFSIAKTSWAIAHAMARILTYEKRYQEAVGMLDIVLSESPPNLHYTEYIGRSRLLRLIGDIEGAERDRKEAELILKKSRR